MGSSKEAEEITSSSQKENEKRETPLTEDQQKLVEEHQWIVKYLINKKQGIRRRLGSQEMFSIGCYALCRAARVFDPTRGVQFQTLAYHYVYGYMRTRADKERKQDREKEVEELGEMFGQPNDPSRMIELKEMVEILFSVLSVREREMSVFRYLENMQLKEIAKLYGISKSRLGQIFIGIVAKLERQRERYKRKIL